MAQTNQNFRPEEKMNIQRSTCAPLLTGVVALSSLAMGACGILDAYKNHEIKCKLNCTSEDSSKAQAQPFNFDLTYWNQSTPRSKLDPSTEVVPLLRSNPFKILANALKTVSEDTLQAKQAIAVTPLTAQAECLKNVFTAALSKTASRSEAKLDYGQCVDHAKLEEKLNASRNTATDGKIRVIELDSAIQLITLGSLPLANGGDALLDAEKGVDLPTTFPFRSLRASELQDPTAIKNLSSHLIRGTVQGTAIERSSSATILKKAWGLLYAGLDERQPLKVEWSPSAGKVKLVGSLATLSASFQRPTTQTQWDAFGYSREFIFADFVVSGSGLELNSQLGWSEQMTMSGSYFLRMNGDLVDAGGNGSQLFHMQALDKPCMLSVGLVTGFQGETPVEQPLGQMTICGNSN